MPRLLYSVSDWVEQNEAKTMLIWWCRMKMKLNAESTINMDTNKIFNWHANQDYVYQRQRRKLNKNRGKTIKWWVQQSEGKCTWETKHCISSLMGMLNIAHYGKTFHSVYVSWQSGWMAWIFILSSCMWAVQKFTIFAFFLFPCQADLRDYGLCNNEISSVTCFNHINLDLVTYSLY